MEGKMMFLVLLFLLSAIGESSVVEERLFESFLSNYSRGYNDDPHVKSLKFEVFQESLARQKALNEYERNHGGAAVYGINQFSDLTPQEFKETYLSPERRIRHGQFEETGGKMKVEAAQGFDWRDRGVIGSIRNQQQCGSCWAFAVVETIESAYAIERKQKLGFTLSSQQLISCDNIPSKGLNGCKGGALESAFKILKEGNTVVVSESAYPFTSKKGEDGVCKTNLPKKGLVLTNFTYFNKATLEQMMDLLQTSPLTTSVNAVAWQDYVGGIVQHHCTDQYVDHAVQVVGYDLTGEVPYWIVRNTWGKSWGEEGYVRVLHGVNMCGIRDEIAAVSSVEGRGML